MVAHGRTDVKCHGNSTETTAARVLLVKVQSEDQEPQNLHLAALLLQHTHELR